MAMMMMMMMMIKVKVGRLNLRGRCYSPLGVKNLRLGP